MPAIALVTAAVETALNRLLTLDKHAAERLKPLNGQRLTVFVTGTPVALSLVFSHRIDVLGENGTFDDVVAQLDKHTCCVRAGLDVFPELKQSSKITSLIQAGKLSVEGELSIAQQASALFQQLNIDWEEIASGFVGDVPAHSAFALLTKARQSATQFLNNAKAGLSNALTEEKDIAVPRIAVTWYADQVSELRDDVARFEARLSKLEQNPPSNG